MHTPAEAPSDAFAVVVNEETQFSIWPDGRTPPPGWHTTGFRGTRHECVAHIEETWTDMLPRSLRTAPEGTR
ncbi:MbtH family NRPS accessory protein [Streptomyces sp. NBC_00190]|uniref:MbtH family protein n=1 Tax=unclassified Streptomyces TaxID=2593676 RepID=UPI002E293369|nr:MbtH family NRPS accessory protein [Streptomyces sp. NBC_00190]WSZ37627.1 MbtH family NRPS accessory protein [Streptomyces sp. NBC_00868]